MDSDPCGELPDGAEVRVDWVKQIEVKGKKKLRAHICEPKIGWSSMSLLICHPVGAADCGVCGKCVRFAELGRFEQMRPSLTKIYKEIIKADFVEKNPKAPIRAIDFGAKAMTKEMLLKAEAMEQESGVFEQIDGDGNPEFMNGDFTLAEWTEWLRWKFAEKGKCGSTWITNYLIHLAKNLKLKKIPAEETAEERMKEVEEAEAERIEIVAHDKSISQAYFFLHRPRKCTESLLEKPEPGSKAVGSVPHGGRCFVDQFVDHVDSNYCEDVTKMAHCKYVDDDDAVVEGWIDANWLFCASTQCGVCKSCTRHEFDDITKRKLLPSRSCIYQFGSYLKLGQIAFTIQDDTETGYIELSATQQLESEIVGQVNCGTKVVVDTVVEVDFTRDGKFFQMRAHVCSGEWRKEGRADPVEGWCDIKKLKCDLGGCGLCPSCWQPEDDSMVQTLLTKAAALQKGEVKDRFATLKKEGKQKQLESENVNLRQRIQVLEDELETAHNNADASNKSSIAKAGWAKMKETSLSSALQKQVSELGVKLKAEEDKRAIDKAAADEEISALKAELDAKGGFDQEMLDREVGLATAKLEAQLRKLKEQHNAELMQVKYEAKHTKWTLENELQQVKDASVVEYERLLGLLETKHHKAMHGLEMKVEEWKGRLQAEERARCSMMMLFDKERREMTMNLEQQEIEKQELEVRLAEMESNVKSLHMLQSRDPDKIIAAKQHETQTTTQGRLEAEPTKSRSKRMLAAKMAEAESPSEAERMLKAKIQSDVARFPLPSHIGPG